MKKKKFIAAIALTLGISCFGACTNTDNTIVFGRYWQTNANLPETSVHETLEYAVSFEKSSGLDGLDYSLSYENGSYVTTLKSERANEKDVYRYTTALEIDVTYTYKTQEFKATDVVKTETVFHSTGLFLRPISSTKTMISHTPINGDVTAVKDCYTRYAYEVNTSYAEDGKSGKSVVTQNFDGVDGAAKSTEKSFSIGSKYTYLDNEQLLFALRALPMNSTSEQANMYSPFNEAMQRVQFSYTQTKDGAQEFNLKENGGEATKKTIPYRTLTLRLKEEYSGESQTAWIAKPTNITNNPYHNVMLRLETPLAYNHGKLIYTLVSITNA